MSKKLLGLIAGLAIALSVMVVPVVHGEDAIKLDDMSNEQLIAYIQSLLQGGSTTPTTTPTETTTPTTGSSNWVSLGIPAGFQFSKNLSQGMTGNDVKYLQIVLNSDSATAVATTGVGSKGNESSYFGGLSKTAVAKFQTKYASSVLTPLGLTQGTGFVGTTTRAKLNELLAQGGTTPTDVSSLTAVQCVTQGYAWNGTVCSDPKAGQIDVSSLSALDCVTKGYAWNGAKCYDPKAGTTTPTTPVVTPVTGAGLVVALSSDSPANTTLVTGQAIAPIAKFVITNKDSVEAKVTKVELNRTGVSADTTLSNVYLFDGATRLTDAATISQGKIVFNNPNGVITIPAGNSVIVTVASDISGGTGQTVGVSLVGMTSNVEVKSTLPINGGTQTIASANLASISIGAPTPIAGSTPTVNAGSTNYTVFSSALTISQRAVNLKGVSFKVIGSIPTDALENIQLYINGVATGDPISLNSNGMAIFNLATPVTVQSGNILEVRANVVKGSSRNFSFSIQNASDLVAVDSVYNVNATVTGIPASTGIVAVNSGTVSVTVDPTFNTTSVTNGTSNVVLAKYNFKAFGEDVKISYLDVLPSVSLDNVVVYANGAPVTSNQNFTAAVAPALSTPLHFGLGSSLVVPANTVVSVEVRADTKTGGANLVGPNVAITLKPFANNGQGVNSSVLVTAPIADVVGPTLSVGTGSLVLAKSSGFSAGNITANTANQKIGSFVIQSSNVEGVRINNISVSLGFTGALSTTNLSNLYVKYNGVSSTPINPQTSNNFSTNVELAKSQAMTIEVFADVATAVNGDTVIASLGISGTGLSSSSSVTAASLPGQTITVATPTLATPTLTTSSPAAQLVLEGTEGVVAEYHFVATNGQVTINELEFSTTNNTIASITVEGKTAYVVGNTATLTDVGFIVPSGYAKLPVKVTYNNVGADGIASNLTSTLTLVSAKYMAGSTLVPLAAINKSANDMAVVGGIPSLQLATGSRSGLTNGEVKLADITVSAVENGGTIKVEELPITITSTGVVTIVSAANNIVVKDAAGNIIPTTNAAFSLAAGGTGTATIIFTTPYDINPGTSGSKTFSVYTSAATVSGAVNTTSLGTKLGDKTLFKFTDVDGNKTGITGGKVYNYSTNTSTISN